jgi:hypothetical protein
MKITIGIDPDTKATGIGVLANGRPVFATTAEANGRLAYNRVKEMGYSLYRALTRCRTSPVLLNGRGMEVVIAVEWFKIRPPDLRKGVKMCNDMMNLQAVAGMAYRAAMDAFPEAEVKHVYPIEWKGTVKKPIHQARLRLKLGKLGEALLSCYTKTKASHVLDGLGLALALHEGKV